MHTFAWFEIARLDGKYYNVLELQNALNGFKDVYAFRSTYPNINIVLLDKEDGSYFNASLCDEKVLDEAIEAVSKTYDVAIPSTPLTYNSRNILYHAKSGDAIILYPATKRYHLNNNREVFVSEEAIEELVNSGFLLPVKGQQRYIVDKSPERD